MRRRLREYMGEIKPITGIVKCINKLSNNYKIFILSSNSKENVKKFVDSYQIKVDGYFCKSSIFGKTRFLRRLLKKLRIKNENAIYIGDEVRDIEASNKARVKCISVTWGYNSKELIEKYNRNFVESPKELLKLLRK